MKLSINWLKDYVEVKLSVEELIERLTMAGLEVEAVEKVGGDTVLEIEITPNRGDCLNMLGLAREVGAITGKAVKMPKSKALPRPKNKISIVVADKADCRRYIATLLENVTVGDSSNTMVERLASMGNRSISNAVDITNFVMFECGQPLHVFDYDKVVGGKIFVRRAKAGEKIVTLDEIERKLDPSILVIADAQKPIAIAGIMGGLDTQVTAQTKRILVEVAHFDLGVVRRASRSLGLRSDSSYRFERQVDAHAAGQASNRAIALLIEQTQGRVTASGEVNHVKKSLAKPLKLTDEAIVELLGTSIPMKKAKDILTRLGFNVRGQGKALLVKTPTYRQDINMPEDLIEEVARVIGFDKLPTSMPLIKATNIPLDTRARDIQQALRRNLLAAGLDEALTYSITSRKSLTRCMIDDTKAIAVTNPLSIEQEVLRPALLPTIMPAIVLNLNRGNKDIRLFEIGNVFNHDGETTQLALVMMGRRHQDWRLSRKDNVEFVDIKGIVENFAQQLKLNLTITKSPAPAYHSTLSANISFEGKVIGHVGLINQTLLQAWGIKADGLYYAEINLNPLLKTKSTTTFFQPLAEYPGVSRDVSIAVPYAVEFQRITDICRQHGGSLLKDVRFIEQYIGDKIQAGHKGLVFSLTYQSPQRTLREEEVNATHGQIVKSICSQTAAIVR